MSVTQTHTATFRNGSKTYYNSTRFFPKQVRADVYRLYGFVRVADNFVDATPQDAAGFHRFVATYRSALAGSPSGDPIIDCFVELMRRREFDQTWVDAFLHSMSLDLLKGSYDTLEETLEYVYGSAEVIGLFMAKLIGLPEQSFPYAQLQGRAMQYINFIRDIEEDQRLGRRYLPLSGSGLANLDRETAEAHPSQFATFIREQIRHYRRWQAQAERGYRFIPLRYLVPIKTASDMYRWTADRIEADPFVVFDRKVKPAKNRVVLRGLANALTGGVDGLLRGSGQHGHQHGHRRVPPAAPPPS